MNKMTSIEFNYSKKVAVQGAVELSKSVNKFYYVTPVIGLCSVLILAYRWMQQGTITSESLLVFIISCLLIFKTYLIEFQAGSNYRSSHHPDSVARYIFTEDGIGITLEGSNSKLYWDKIYDVIRNKKGLLIFTRPKIAHWIPDSEYNEEQISAIEELLRTNNVDYKNKSLKS